MTDPASKTGANTRTRKACLNCGRRKVRCPNKGDDRPCDTCVQGGLDCVWPPSTTQAPGGPQNKIACDACRKNRVRCSTVEEQDHDRRCTSCREKEVECSLAVLQDEHTSDGQHGSDPVEPVAGPSNYPGALTMERPALTVDPTARIDDPPPSSTSVSPVTRTNSPRGNWMEVCLAPSPEAESYEELYEAYAAQ